MFCQIIHDTSISLKTKSSISLLYIFSTFSTRFWTLFFRERVTDLLLCPF
nr:MAG TPA: hypothetical protein [Caudoviricetes sp.]